MAKLDLTKYGITGTTEVVYNPSYEQLFEEETKPGLEGYDKGQVTDLGAVNARQSNLRYPNLTIDSVIAILCYGTSPKIVLFDAPPLGMAHSDQCVINRPCSCGTDPHSPHGQ